jgi:CheY-like chemotaxis protein
MPVVSGIEAFQSIRKINSDVPIIAQTAFALEIDKQKFLDMGFTDYVSKPIRVEELISKINKYVE